MKKRCSRPINACPTLHTLAIVTYKVVELKFFIYLCKVILSYGYLCILGMDNGK